MAVPSAWEENDRVRFEASAAIARAAQAASVRRLVQESIAFGYDDGGDAWLDEDAPVAGVDVPVRRRILSGARAEVARDLAQNRCNRVLFRSGSAVRVGGVLLCSRKPRAEKDTPSPDALIVALATRQHGVVTLAQLFACGLSRSGITWRLRSGRLHRIHVGVYAVGHPGLSRRGAELAAVLACGRGAALSHLPAGGLHAISRFRAKSIEVVTPWQRAPRGVTVHRCRGLSPLDVTSEQGVPVTTVHRLLVDLTDVLTKWQLANVIHEAAFRGRFVEPAIRDAMSRANGRHNLHLLEQAIALHRGGSAGTRSGAEDAFLALGLPEPLVNTQLLGFEVDFVWPDHMVAVEVDGPGHFRAPTAEDDALQDDKLAASGFTTLRFTDAEVRERGKEVARRTAEVLDQCRRTPNASRSTPGSGDQSRSGRRRKPSRS